MLGASLSLRAMNELAAGRLGVWRQLSGNADGGTSDETSGGDMPVPEALIRRIAVLPLNDLSRDPEPFPTSPHSYLRVR